MKLLQIVYEELFLKENIEELEREALKEWRPLLCDERYEKKKLDVPKYYIEMTPSEFQLVNFYLELEKRKPIMNINIDVESEK